MLFHLKEPDYEKTRGLSVTRFYGREPKQILATLDHYSEKMKKDGFDVNTPNLAWWAKRKFSGEDIEQVGKGSFHFITGMISLDDKGDLFDREIKVRDDFSVYVPHENLLYFWLWKESVRQMRRGELYKLQNPIELFMNTSFVPEDIATAIVECNLTPYLEDIKQDMTRRAELSKHPGVKVDLVRLETRVRTDLPTRN